MVAPTRLSPPVKHLMHHAERMLGIEIQVIRRKDAPESGILIDSFSYATDRNVIVVPSTRIGLLRDFSVTNHTLLLLMKGSAAQQGGLKVPSFDGEHALYGARQIYLDLLKDERTRTLDVRKKKKINFYLYLLFFETLSELPWKIVSQLVLSHQCAVLRNAQVYDLMKESFRDMHELVTLKDLIPARYFALHNGLYYARDFTLAEATATAKLQPEIHIPELQRFRNLEVKEMLTRRWSTSSWYQTKIVGETLYAALKKTIALVPLSIADPASCRDLYQAGRSLFDHWIQVMNLEDWYIWESPIHQRQAILSQEQIGQQVERTLFGD